MTAVSEILIDSLSDVLAVPLHAVVERNDEHYVVVKDGTGMAARPVSLGRANDTRVVVTEGLLAGESVALNPQDFVDQLLADAS